MTNSLLILWVVVISNIFGIFTPKFGEDEPIFDEHIFQRGWNHQLLIDHQKCFNSHVTMTYWDIPSPLFLFVIGILRVCKIKQILPWSFVINRDLHWHGESTEDKEEELFEMLAEKDGVEMEWDYMRLVGECVEKGCLIIIKLIITY